VLQRVAFAALGALLLAAAPAGAQYFGRNKVQYDRRDFRVMETPHFEVYYYAEERDAVLQAARMAERWYDKLSAALEHQFDRRQPIILYASHGHFAQTSITPVLLGDGIGGFTDHQAGRVVLPFGAGLAETNHVLGHELVHAFQRDILRRHGSSLAMMPLWFGEGMAEYLSVGRIDANTAMWVRDAVNADRLPRLEDLNNPRWFPYRYGQALWTYLAERYGESIAARAMKIRAKGNAIARLAAATGDTADELSRGWREAMTRLAADTTRGEMTAADRAIVSSTRNGGRLNVGPALSPDGTQLVFLSERDGYAVDVFLADAETGAIRRKLLSTATDPHVDTIQFIDSAGAWDAGGRRFALATVRDGTAMLMLFDIPSGSVAREVPIDEVDEVFTPTWSPDGSQIAFSGLKGGATDLYVLEVNSGVVRAITRDLYADLQPAWSPDGTEIAFVTDRFSSSIDALSFGNYRLASVEMPSGTPRALPSFDDVKNIDPHWSPDGGSVYFVADRDGVSNIYRVALAGGEVSQVTDVQTGVSGITALSPAIAVASSAGTVAYTVYRDGVYEIRTLGTTDSGRPTIVAGVPLPSQSIRSAAPLMTPDPAPARQFSERPYARGLSLLSIGQPYVSAGGGAFGSFVRAGVSFGLGDLLGEQQLETALQVGKDVMDFAVQSVYLNRRSRWTWGSMGGQIPIMTGFTRTSHQSSAADGATIVRESVLSEEIHRQASALFMYPFNRARRIELSAGFDAISFRTETLTNVYSGATGRLIEETRTRRPGLPHALIGQAGAALVHDTAVHGAASPVLGERYRFGLATSYGDLRVATLVADYRRYVMPLRPFTIAMRLQHVGRYGRDGADPRLLPFVWMVQDTVRGFDGRQLPNPTCASGSAACDTIDAATTNRLLAANVELRFPLVGALRRTTSYGTLPIEGLIFTDTGAFWTASPAAAAAHMVLRSVGAGVRLNAGGLVFEFDGARPIGTFARGWRLSANFRPGF
jgi:WD40-like Beta Propeller Repeat